MASDSLRALVGRRLEAGAGGPLARALGMAMGAAAGLAVRRPLRLPAEARVIGVGSATLGGAGKTPLAIALARALAEGGAPVALVGHAYRATPGRARVVAPTDRVAEVGDDALSSARLLAGSGVVVVVGPSRQAAVDLAAARGAAWLVVDGLLQARPAPLHASLLVVDAGVPWGAGACPPAGDLRASKSALLGATDRVVALVVPGAELDPELRALDALAVPSWVSGAVDPAGRAFALSSLAGQRIGLLVAIARPERVAAAVVAAGVRPVVTEALGDHAAPGPRELARLAGARVDAWLTTARCATKLPAELGGAPVLALVHEVTAGELGGWVSRLAARPVS